MRFDLSQIKMSYHDINRKITLPAETSEELAELIGILAGDGHVDFHPKCYDYIVQINGHLHDDLEYYQTYVQPLIKILFNIKLREVHRSSDTSIILTRKSKGIVSYLTAIGFKKKGCIITIPQWIINNPIYTTKFIRGLYDTDGGLSLKRKRNYPVLSLGLKDIKTVLYLAVWTKLREIPYYFGFRWSYWEHNGQTKKGLQAYIQISGIKNITKWIKIVGVSNQKKIKKCGWG